MIKSRVLYICICSIFLMTACASESQYKIEPTEERVVEEAVTEEIDDTYQFLIKYQGKYYHYAQSETLIKPELELGEITGQVQDGTLPINDMETNGSCIGDMLYAYEGDDAIYMESVLYTDGKTVCYARYEKGIRRMRDVEENSLPSTYVWYNGITYDLAERRERIQKEFEPAATIQSWRNLFTEEELCVTHPNLLGGEIYVSKENENIIYVKPIRPVFRDGKNCWEFEKYVEE